MFKLKKDKIAYIQVGKHIIKRIANNELTKGNTIGTVRNLAQQYKVTTKTIQKSLHYLEEKGVISRVQSSGLYVLLTREEALEMLMEEAEELTRNYLEDLREINKLESVLSLIHRGLKDD